ncbi:ATP-binding protein [Paractinoplanes globisporus]|uniref:ATP-binding protein n=1 Tax=Paractinoplanes globisporus TaxID=113565 RepID=A0ABW6W6U2_9ACTN|nr:ATP-binding protein [Actinoplanes globisporus]
MTAAPTARGTLDEPVTDAPAGAALAAFRDPADHLRAELDRLELELRRLVLRRRLAGRIAGDTDYRGLYVPDELVDALLDPPAIDRAGQERLAAADRHVRQARRDNQARLLATAPGALRLPGLGLCPLDQDLLLLAVSVELEPRYPALISWLQDDAALRRPTAALAAALWPDPEAARDPAGPRDQASGPGTVGVRSRLHAAAPLRATGLLEVAPPGGSVPATLLDQALVVPCRVVDHLLGDDRPDGMLADFLGRHRAGRAEVSLPNLATPPGTAAALADAAGRLRSGRTRVAVLTGPPDSGRRTAAIALAAAIGGPYLVLDSDRIPSGLLDAPHARDALHREVRLAAATLVVVAADRLAESLGAAKLARVVEAAPRAILTGGSVWHHGVDGTSGWLDVAVEEPGCAERTALWRAALARAQASASDADVTAIADAFRLGPGRILAAGRAAVRARSGPAELDRTGLAEAARAQSATALSRLARRVTSPYGWADLVVPGRVRRQLDEVVAAARLRPLVRDEWGFRDQRGLHVLFYGPSGTGKTMSAGLLAAELGQELYAVDLSAVVSKYIGETEKNLEEVFTTGRAANAILFFDEADALFGRRSQVKDAHDRYANVEVAYLLSRIEQYDGLTILATNLRGNLDEAFARRLRHTVEFPPPDAAMRRRIWDVALPPGVPLASDVDLDVLARHVELTGAGIRNAALTAAYLAAAGKGRVGMPELVQGVARELRKLGRAPSRAAFGEYFELLAEPAEETP